ncbi:MULTISPECIES: hypothetical protein [Sphingobacterium]|uniref:hypothetical protein n=1 Tax=Sphingobacterium TaxID=28453 RepID=UPI00257C9B5C|nr:MULTISPECIES: hypothetical protein [Sphingobacterium]
MEKIYRQVSVKERLPETQGGYLTSVGLVNFHGTKFNKWVDWWLEELELPTITVIRNAAMENKDIAGYFEELAFETGANYILNTLKGEKR